MPQLDRPEIFNSSWHYGEMPEVEIRNPVDIPNLAAMGSCFARNLNRWLEFHKQTDRIMPWDILFNPMVIRDELARLYSPETAELARENPLKELTSDGEERFTDPWRTWLTRPTRAELEEANTTFDGSARDFLSTANGLLVTFGLTEVWSREDNPDMALNKVPVGSIRRGEEGWFPRLANVAEVTGAIAATAEIFREHVSETADIIFTLSPVPLKHTATGLDIRVANKRSKATITTAISEVVGQDEGIEYFPSCEIVESLAERDAFPVWQVDGRHVTARTVDIVAQTFMGSHGAKAEQSGNQTFWVPRVDTDGKIVGRIYSDGRTD